MRRKQRRRRKGGEEEEEGRHQVQEGGHIESGMGDSSSHETKITQSEGKKRAREEQKKKQGMEKSSPKGH